ncbi:hypothetical protein FHU38_005193 [Saccharomonospora amisosensis]|uniref:ARB-07466-like C-terminal domain-containing protein n=1 Tax=Saccharomonospora amisosensis TaxID=1128677 RepID=A0A7X5ZTX8_9PSEU|nr:hypothetical protein [Saccharomonospora amisosensis]NIJ14785.1 hypothetical protein [Saccharomonospora amisosensis]
MTGKLGTGVAALVLAIPILIGAAITGITNAFTASSASPGALTCTPDGTPTTVPGLTTQQRANATTIVAVGKQMHVPQYGRVIAIATAMQESGLRNLHHGDRDSLGLFQQRPSMGWGTPQQILTPSYAATQFYNHLLAIPNWQHSDLATSAQAVQRSGFPNRYAAHEHRARQVVGALTGLSCTNLTGAPGQTRTDWPAEHATEPDPTSNGRITPRTLALVHTLRTTGVTGTGLRCHAPRPANPTSDHPRGRACDLMFNPHDPASVADGWRAANWLTAHQTHLGIHYLIWQGQYWSAKQPTWTPYTSSAYGCPNPANLTGCHYDHVHISMY